MIDWDRAVERNRDALLRILESLFVMAGLVADDPAAVLPRHAYNRLRRIAQPNPP